MRFPMDQLGKHAVNLKGFLETMIFGVEVKLICSSHYWGFVNMGEVVQQYSLRPGNCLWIGCVLSRFLE